MNCNISGLYFTLPIPAVYRIGYHTLHSYAIPYQSKWAEPSFSQRFEPDRITLSLAFDITSDKKQAIKTGDKKSVRFKKK